MDERLVISINKGLIVLNDFRQDNNLSNDDWPTKIIDDVLTILKNKLDKKDNIEVRLLRAMKDVYVVSFRNFEGTDLHKAIDNIDDQLTELFKKYSKLEPLGMDFGKGNPI